MIKSDDKQLYGIITLLLLTIFAIPKVFQSSIYETRTFANVQLQPNTPINIGSGEDFFSEEQMNQWGLGRSVMVPNNVNGQHTLELNHDMLGPWTGNNPWYTAKEIVSIKVVDFSGKFIGSINMEFYPTQVVNWTGTSVKVSINEANIQSLLQTSGGQSNLEILKNNYKALNGGEEISDEDIQDLVMKSFKEGCNIVQNMCIYKRQLTNGQTGCFDKNGNKICSNHTNPSCKKLGIGRKTPCYNPYIDDNIQEGIQNCTWVMDLPTRDENGVGKRNVNSSKNYSTLRGMGLSPSDIASHYNAGLDKKCKFPKGELTIKYVCPDCTEIAESEKHTFKTVDAGTEKVYEAKEIDGKKYLGFSYSLGGEASCTPTKTDTKVSIQDITADNIGTSRVIHFIYECDEVKPPEDTPEPEPKPKECPPGTIPGGEGGLEIPPIPDDKSELMVWTSRPYAYGEIKNNNYTEGRVSETWNAMAGLPSDEKLFLDVGASMFSMSIASDKYKVDVLEGPTNHSVTGTASDYCWYQTSYIPVCGMGSVPIIIDSCTGSKKDATCPTKNSPGSPGEYTAYVEPHWQVDWFIHPLQILGHKVVEYDIRGVSVLEGILDYTDLIFPLAPFNYVNIDIEEAEPSLEFSGLPTTAPNRPIWQEEIWKMDALNVIKEAYPNSYFMYKPRKFDIIVSVGNYSKTYKVLQDIEVKLPSTQDGQPGNYHLAYKAEIYEPSNLGKEFGSNHNPTKYETTWTEPISVASYGKCGKGNGATPDNKPAVDISELNSREQKDYDDFQKLQNEIEIINKEDCKNFWQKNGVGPFSHECRVANMKVAFFGMLKDLKDTEKLYKMIDKVLAAEAAVVGIGPLTDAMNKYYEIDDPYKHIWQPMKVFNDERPVVMNTITAIGMAGAGLEYSTNNFVEAAEKMIKNGFSMETYSQYQEFSTKHKWEIHAGINKYWAGIIKWGKDDSEIADIVYMHTSIGYLKGSILDKLGVKPSTDEVNKKIKEYNNELRNGKKPDIRLIFDLMVQRVDNATGKHPELMELENKLRDILETAEGRCRDIAYNALPPSTYPKNLDWVRIKAIDEHNDFYLWVTGNKEYLPYKDEIVYKDYKISAPHLEAMLKIKDTNINNCNDLLNNYSSDGGSGCNTSKTNKQDYTREILTLQIKYKDSDLICGVKTKPFRYMYWEIDGDPDTSAYETNFLPIAKQWDPDHHIDIIGFKDFSAMGSRRGEDLPLFYKDNITITDIPNGEKKSSPLTVQYKYQNEDPKLPSPKYEKFGASAEVTAVKEAMATYHDEMDPKLINDIIVHNPIAISKVKIEPEPLSDHRIDSQKRYLPVKLHPDSYFDIEFEHSFMASGTVGKEALAELTNDKSAAYVKGLDTTRWISKNKNDWKRGDDPTKMPGRFIIAPTELWRVVESGGNWVIDKKSDGSSAIYKKGDIIPVPLGQDTWRFFIPLSADEFAANDITTFVMGGNNVASTHDPHVDEFNEFQWTTFNFERYAEGGDKSAFRADHFGMRNRTVDMVGRIGNFTWNYSKDPLWQNFFREPAQPKSWLINKLVYKPDMYKLRKFIMSPVDAYDNRSSLLDGGIGINRFFQEQMYDNGNGRIGPFSGEKNEDLPVKNPKSSKMGYPIYYTFHSIGQREDTIPTIDASYAIKCPSGKLNGAADMYVSKRGGTFENIGPGADKNKVKEFLLHTKLAEYKYNPLMLQHRAEADRNLKDIYMGTPFNFQESNELKRFNGKAPGPNRSQKWFGMWNLPSSTKFTKPGAATPKTVSSKHFVDVHGCEMEVGYHIISDNGIWAIHTSNHPQVTNEENPVGIPPADDIPDNPRPPENPEGDPNKPPTDPEKPKPSPPGDNTPPPIEVDIGEPAYRDQDITGTW